MIEPGGSLELGFLTPQWMDTAEAFRIALVGTANNVYAVTQMIKLSGGSAEVSAGEVRVGRGEGKIRRSKLGTSSKYEELRRSTRIEVGNANQSEVWEGGRSWLAAGEREGGR